MDPAPSLDRFVAEQRRPLLATAYLLTGADAPAADLVTRALVSARPVWRRLPHDADAGARRDAALTGLVRAHLGRWGRWSRGGGTVTGASAAPWWVAEADAEAAHRLLAALDRLEDRARTAVVLRHHEGLAAADVGRLLGEPDPAGLLAAAERELAAEVPDPSALGARLDGLAALGDHSTLDDEAAVSGVRDRVAGRRRRAVGVAAVAVALVAGAVLAPDRPATPQGSSVASAPPAGPRLPDFGDLYGAPTRGSLADDRAFLDAVLAREPGSPEESSDRRVVFAGDAAGLRWVLVAARSPGSVESRLFTGPAGTPAADLEVASMSSSATADGALGLTAEADGALAVLVLAGRDDEIAISPGVDVAPDGTASRSYRPVETSRGVAATPIVRTTAAGVRFTVTRDGVTSEPRFASFGSWSTPAPAPPPPPPPRSGTVVSADAVHHVADSATSATGWSGDDVTVTVLGSGTFAAEGAMSAEGVVVAVTLPNGAVVTAAGWVRVEANGSSLASCGSALHPAGTDLDTLVVAAGCSLYDTQSTADPTLVVVAAPAGTPDATLSASTGTVPPAVLPLPGGWGAVVDDTRSVDRVDVGGQVITLDPGADPLQI
ncbi:hypothetical protein GB931_13315 [Modestobacter sp. I12A-02628]|uniref:DNA-directed RNA polymerase specialized sigma24 family protein n=1 Tax=Goekera deserti TaxID=2497753 RepID=A0A7K3W9Q8_9ACTN|nr:hypothetical protein [Goekera deserti]MPQ98882.1 hypothetical protein [Goekera deserti]NDI49619.1 hypothetical protein [Goekera deserti]NEL53188.1 hypothetical protein [Goekera deserti]